MRLSTRKQLDGAFSSVGIISLMVMLAVVFLFLIPIFVKGSSAFIFRETVERRKFMLEHFNRGDRKKLNRQVRLTDEARRPVFDMIAAYEEECGWASPKLVKIKELVRNLLGPLPGDEEAVMERKQYGQTRWDRVQFYLDELLYKEAYDYSDPTKMGTLVKVDRSVDYEGTAVAPVFGYMKENLEAMMLPELTVYWRFLFDEEVDSHFFGGIWASVLGTFYLVIGSMLIAAPFGIISAIYLTMYAGDTGFVSLIRICISTLAGVPSVVFGLFGLSVFIYRFKISEGPSVLVGSLTLSLLLLPTVIRASEEALRAVPRTYTEASMGLGATKWMTIVKVVLPAALPGIITGIIISMGRAAGETAPILFTAAVTMGAPVKPLETLSHPSPALPSSIYSVVSEHRAVDEIMHVPYGMVLTLVLLVILLNLTAIIIRARVSRKLRG